LRDIRPDIGVHLAAVVEGGAARIIKERAAAVTPKQAQE